MVVAHRVRMTFIAGRRCGSFAFPGSAMLSLARLVVGCAILLVLTLAPAGGQEAKQPPKGKPKFTNRLAKATSPYLLMHAHNPTDWYPWGPEAFDKAKKEGKLVFLSVGYSSCFWCHVMERESFSNEEVAKILNAHFVCIKVDREERPDIDQIYMTALNMLGQNGGWPMSMFLLPDGRPIVGGTYFPREDREVKGETYPGFKSLLKILRDEHKDHPKKIEEQAEKLAAATSRSLENIGGIPGVAVVDLDRKLVGKVLEDLQENFDPVHGGFGSPQRKFQGAKFPLPARLEFLLQQYRRTKDAKILEMLTLTLDQMALGGIYDQIGGGFHRYTVERTWTVPHFEKMLYDNAQLLEIYAQAYRETKSPLYRRVIEETVAYLKREMLSPEGAFYSSQDAETEEEEGRSYVWTAKELADALPMKAELDLVRTAYSAEGAPNFEKKYHILRLAKPLPELAKELKMSEAELHKQLDPLRKKLYDVRAKREQPFLNKIALTSWSGLMVAGLAEAGQALNEPKYIALAAKAADFVLTKQRTPEGRLLRSYGAAPGEQPKATVNGYLEDYSFLAHGLLTLHTATKDKKWLDAARALTDTMVEFHGEPKRGGFYFTAHDHEKFFARSKEQYDGATPSGNSIAARNLVRLWQATGDAKYLKDAERTFRAFAGALQNNGPSLAAMAYALDDYLAATEKLPKAEKK
jgi:uncharacterized protein YyaL (SSP411 family)